MKDKWIDSEISDLLLLSAHAKSKEDRIKYIRLLYKKSHDRLHPDIDTFLFDKRFLGYKQSEVRKPILDLFHRIFEDRNITEVQALLGSGSGKSFFVCNMLAYMTHELLSYINPQEYFGLVTGTPIAIINMSVNAPQALNVIFRFYVSLIERIEAFRNIKKKADIVWENTKKKKSFDGSENFDSEYYEQAKGQITFLNKHILAISGHSKASSVFGYAVYAGAIDEMSWIDPEGAYKMVGDSLDALTPAEEIYAGLTKARKSRFKDKGLIALISTPRNKMDPLSRRVLMARQLGTPIALETGEVIDYKPPKDYRGDRIEVFKYQDKLSLIGATYLFTGEQRSAYIPDENDIKARRDFGCEIPDSSFSALPDPEVVERKANRERKNPVDEDRMTISPDFKPQEGASYFIHFDAALSGDNAGLVMTHYDFERNKYVVDFFFRIKTSKENKLKFQRVINFINVLRERGFNIVKITMDGFQSAKMLQDLSTLGYVAELLSVDRNRAPYETLIDLLINDMLDYPEHEVFEKEMKNLQDNGKKFDHPAHNADGTPGSKDVADATAGALYSCVLMRTDILFSPKQILEATRGIMNYNGEISVHGIIKPYMEINERGILKFNAPVPKFQRIVFLEVVDGKILTVLGHYEKGKFIVNLFKEWEYEIFIKIAKTFISLFNVSHVAVSGNIDLQVLSSFKTPHITIVSYDPDITDKARLRHIRRLQSISMDFVTTFANYIKNGALGFVNEKSLVNNLIAMNSRNYKNLPYGYALINWLYYSLQIYHATPWGNKMPTSRLL